MMPLRRVGLRIVGFLALFFILAGAALAVRVVWSAFAALPKEVAVGLLTAATTIIVATVTVVVGRFLERKKDFAAVHRDKKIPVYDEFLKGIFQTFWSGSETPPSPQPVPDTVALLREWQRQIILWGGVDVIRAYNRWKDSLAEKPQTIQTIVRTEELFLAIRKDLGHDDRKLEKHPFVGFILAEADLFKTAVKINPNLPMERLSQIEAELKAKREG